MRDIKNTLSYKWFQNVWNEGRRDMIDEMMNREGTFNDLVGDDHPQGLEGFKTFYDNFRKSFTNINVKVEDVLQQDDMEATRCVVTLTNVDTGKKATFSGMTFTKIRDGKIAVGWNCFDFLGMYQQMGMELVGR